MIIFLAKTLLLGWCPHEPDWSNIKVMIIFLAKIHIVYLRKVREDTNQGEGQSSLMSLVRRPDDGFHSLTIQSKKETPSNPNYFFSLFIFFTDLLASPSICLNISEFRIDGIALGSGGLSICFCK